MNLGGSGYLIRLDSDNIRNKIWCHRIQTRANSDRIRENAYQKNSEYEHF